MGGLVAESSAIVAAWLRGERAPVAGEPCRIPAESRGRPCAAPLFSEQRQCQTDQETQDGKEVIEFVFRERGFPGQKPLAIVLYLQQSAEHATTKAAHQYNRDWPGAREATVEEVDQRQYESGDHGYGDPRQLVASASCSVFSS